MLEPERVVLLEISEDLLTLTRRGEQAENPGGEARGA
jgi:hypothetical protein